MSTTTLHLVRRKAHCSCMSTCTLSCVRRFLRGQSFSCDEHSSVSCEHTLCRVVEHNSIEQRQRLQIQFWVGHVISGHSHPAFTSPSWLKFWLSLSRKSRPRQSQQARQLIEPLFTNSHREHVTDSDVHKHFSATDHGAFMRAAAEKISSITRRSEVM